MKKSITISVVCMVQSICFAQAQWQVEKRQSMSGTIAPYAHDAMQMGMVPYCTTQLNFTPKGSTQSIGIDSIQGLSAKEGVTYKVVLKKEVSRWKGLLPADAPSQKITYRLVKILQQQPVKVDQRQLYGNWQWQSNGLEAASVAMGAPIQLQLQAGKAILVDGAAQIVLALNSKNNTLRFKSSGENNDNELVNKLKQAVYWERQNKVLILKDAQRKQLQTWSVIN